MTDYEMISVTVEIVNTLWAIFGIYVSIVFAFLIVSYLAASQLASRLVTIVITLYTLVALWSFWGLNRTAVTLGSAIAEIQQAVAEGRSSLAWYPGVSIPEFMLTVIPLLVTAIAVIAYIGSIAFFFHQRKATSSD